MKRTFKMINLLIKQRKSQNSVVRRVNATGRTKQRKETLIGPFRSSSAQSRDGYPKKKYRPEIRLELSSFTRNGMRLVEDLDDRKKTIGCCASVGVVGYMMAARNRRACIWTLMAIDRKPLAGKSRIRYTLKLLPIGNYDDNERWDGKKENLDCW